MYYYLIIFTYNEVLENTAKEGETMNNDIDLKVSVVLQQKKDIKEIIDEKAYRHINDYLISIILILSEHNGDDHLDCRVFFL